MGDFGKIKSVFIADSEAVNIGVNMGNSKLLIRLVNGSETIGVITLM